MSLSNNSLRTIDGQNTLFCDTIEITEEIVLDGDNGSDGAIIKSDGVNARWSLLEDLLTAGTGIDISGTTISTANVPNSALQHNTISDVALGGSLNNLIAGTNVSFVDSGGGILTTYNGDTQTTMITANTEYTAGLGLELNTLTFNARVDTDTMTRSHDTNHLAVLKVPNALTASSPLTLTDGFDGSSAKSISISNIANSVLQNSTISGKALGTNLDSLTASSPLTLTGGYNGSSAKSISISNIANSDLQNSTISGVALGGTLNALSASSPLTLTSGYDGSASKSISISNIPNSTLQNSTISGVALGGNLADLTAGTNITFTTSGGAAATTYNGSTGITINATGGGGGGGVAVSEIDEVDVGGGELHYYLQFFSTDGFTAPEFSSRPALHPNEINDIGVAPPIDGFLAMTEGETVIFTKKIPVGWEGIEIKFGLLNQHGGGFIPSTNVSNCRVNIKEKFLGTDNPTPELFDCNVAHPLSTHLINNKDQMVVVEVTDIESEHSKAYTAGGWIRIIKTGH